MRAVDARLKRIKELEETIRLREGLPHLYGWKWYRWAREFFDSKNRFCLLTAGNQASKSSSQIRKVIHWATSPDMWKHLWPTKPQQFWYMYPSSQQATSEFETKWQQFLPRNEFKNHPQYGWKQDVQQKQIKGIYFNSGVRLYFKSYTQRDVNLQSSSVHYIGCDEEVDVGLYHELIFRLSATRGYFSNVFTATIGQDFWRRAMDPGPHDEEVLPNAFKKTVSLYDCLTYENGSPSHWTVADIKRIEDSCGSHNEVLKRVHGKFIKDVNSRKYPTFDIQKHVTGGGYLPRDYSIYAAVDLGSGGEGNHPAAIVFVGVHPKMHSGRVFKAWRGDGVITSAGDVFNKFLEMKAEIGRPITAQYYDFGGKDFDIISTRAGEPFIKAEKSHEKGEHVVNTVFKFGMLTIDEGDEQLRKLAMELATIPKDGPRKKIADDLADCLRYVSCGIPWDFTKILPKEETQEEPDDQKERARAATKNRFGDQIVISQKFDEDREEAIESEFSELSELLSF